MKKTKTKKYSAYYLAIILAAILLAEGTLFSVSTSWDWKNAASILDVSGAVTETLHDTASLFVPEANVVSDINEFYQEAAIQTESLLRVSFQNLSSDLEFTYGAISDFYSQSGMQMASLLGIPDLNVRPSVAGISITK